MKKRLVIPLLAVACFFTPSLITRASAGSSIPSYYDLLDFDLMSPAARATSVGGFANPAAYRMMPGSELQYFWSDEGAKVKAINRWGIFWGSENLGFGAIHNRLVPTPDGFASVTDYRLALSLGDRNGSIGIGYGWSGGDDAKTGRTGLIQLGAIRRIGRYLSMGAAGAFSTSSDERKVLADLAVRPLGDERLTFFGDVEAYNETRIDDARFSAGVSAELVNGLNVIGRYFEDESFTVSMGFSFGEAGAAVSSRVTKQGDISRTLYGVRLGYGERNVFDEYLERNSAYLSLDLKGGMRYLKYEYFDEGPTLMGTIRALEDALNDPRVAGVALNLSGARMARAKAWELREKLKELQQAGKHVVVFIDNAGMTIYHLASVADVIVMDSDGSIELPGFVAGRTYLRNLLVKLGLGFDEWRFFKYKSAFESISRENMSEADKEQLYAMIEDFYDTVKHDVAESRNISPDTFDKWVNEMDYFPPSLAMEEGLVDTLGRWEDVQKMIKRLEGSKKKYIRPNRLAAESFPSELWGENPRVAVVYGLGVCDMDKGIKARRLEKIFHELRDDKRVKAVVFRVDSPGGDGMASDVVAEALRLCARKKPVIVSQGSVAGSGGYWISMYGDTILACPNTVTGSIGVIGGWVWNKGFGDKVGLTWDKVQIGRHADIGRGLQVPFLGVRVPERNLDEEERAVMKKYILEFYDEFVKKVANGRGMKEDEVREIAQGRVWSGVDGKEIGLVDMLGGLDKAIKIAKEAAGIEDETVDIREYPKLGLFNLAFLKGMRGIPFLGSMTRATPLYKGYVQEENVYELYDEYFLRAVIENAGRPVFMVSPESLPGEDSGSNLPLQ
jgi:protease-4